MTGSTEQLRDFSPGPQKTPTVRVLVVDDEPLIRWSVTQTLMDTGCPVIEAADGRGTIQALKDATTPIDVVLLDYRLPDSNNLQLLAKIRAMSPRSRVVLMTAYGTPEVAAEALRLGAVCFVNKPLEMQEVANLVSRAHGSTPA
jgi:two-component system, NtrC family, response regulator AtoC